MNDNLENNSGAGYEGGGGGGADTRVGLGTRVNYSYLCILFLHEMKVKTVTSPTRQ